MKYIDFTGNTSAENMESHFKQCVTNLQMEVSILDNEVRKLNSLINFLIVNQDSFESVSDIENSKEYKAWLKSEEDK